MRNTPNPRFTFRATAGNIVSGRLSGRLAACLVLVFVGAILLALTVSLAETRNSPAPKAQATTGDNRPDLNSGSLTKVQKVAIQEEPVAVLSHSQSSQESANEKADPSGDDPDLPNFMNGKLDKEDYLRLREEHINRLRGIEPGEPFDPTARVRAIREMNRQEGRPNNKTTTVDVTFVSLIKSIFPSLPISDTIWKPIGPAP